MNELEIRKALLIQIAELALDRVDLERFDEILPKIIEVTAVLRGVEPAVVEAELAKADKRSGGDIWDAVKAFAR